MRGRGPLRGGPAHLQGHLELDAVQLRAVARRASCQARFCSSSRQASAISWFDGCGVIEAGEAEQGAFLLTHEQDDGVDGRETGEHGPFNSWGRDRFWDLQGVDLNALTSPEERALRNVVYGSCLSEMVNSARFVDALEEITEPVTRDATRRLLALRRAHPALRLGDLDALVAYLRSLPPK